METFGGIGFTERGEIETWLGYLFYGESTKLPSVYDYQGILVDEARFR